jgi:hypothetical protein
MRRDDVPRLVPLAVAAARLKVSRWTLRRWLARVPEAGQLLGGRWFVIEEGISTVRDLAHERGKR